MTATLPSIFCMQLRLWTHISCFHFIQIVRRAIMEACLYDDHACHLYGISYIGDLLTSIYGQNPNSVKKKVWP